MLIRSGTTALLVTLVISAFSVAVPAAAGARKGTLAVTVTGLPVTTPGDVRLAGNRVKRTIGKTTQVRLRAGRYRLTVRTAT